MIVPHDQPREMAAALERLARDDGFRLALARASKERAAKFSIARMAGALESLYLESNGQLSNDPQSEAGRAIARHAREAFSAIR
jgi:hypothetical protein